MSTWIALLTPRSREGLRPNVGSLFLLRRVTVSERTRPEAQAQGSWERTRARGRLRYVLRNVLEAIGFGVALDLLVSVKGLSEGLELSLGRDALAILAIFVPLGTVGGLVGWSIRERRYLRNRDRTT
jgi:hypothetical protein